MIRTEVVAPQAARLTIKDLHKQYSGVKVLQGVNLGIAPGEIVGVLGPNGAGKTTLINCLSGVIRPTSGNILHDGRDITTMTTARRATRGIVRTFQNLRLFGSLSAAENVDAGLTRLGRLARNDRVERIQKTLSAQGVLQVADRPVRELPYGVQRRVEIARALIAVPNMLLLDEPGAGLGTAECELLSKALLTAREEFGCGILLIDHNVPFIASIADRLVLLAEGRIVRDAPPAELLADPIVASIYLGKGTRSASA
jgi:ABC-type branched-subunit amino acid transport system ATPase component